MRLLVAVFLVSAWLVPSPSIAQPSSTSLKDYILRSWDTRDGLPQNTVTAILQTRDGYLWLGTFGGLVRFDGNAFTVFTPGNAPGLASARITVLFEDRNSGLWIGTEGALTRYDRGRFESFFLKDSTTGIAALAQDRDGTVWTAVSGIGISRFNGKTFDRVELIGNTFSLVMTPDGDVWAGGSKIARFRGGKLIETFPGDGAEVAAMFIDSTGQLWAGGWSLRKWDGQRFVEVPLPLTPMERGGIRSIVEDRSGDLWIATPLAGLFRLRNGVVDRYTRADGLVDDYIRALAIDRDDNHWIGTDVGGLMRLRRQSVFSYQRPGSNRQSIGPIVDDGEGGLWIGAVCGGLLHFRDGNFRVYTQRDGMPSNDCVWALHRDPDGTLWIGTAGSSVVRFRDGVFTSLQVQLGMDRSPVVTAITRDHRGTLWIGRSDGLVGLENGEVRTYGPPAGVPPGIVTIFQDRAGVLWLGTMNNGLHRFEHDRVTASYTTAQGLSGNHVRAIHQDADGVMWIGTYGGGLSRFKDGKFTPFLEKDGLHDNAVSRIIEDERGRLWMSGNKGIFHVARSQLNDFADGRSGYITSVSYGTADGMIIDETNGGSPAGWRTTDGRLWFPTIKGLVEIRPESGAAPPPPVFVERAIVDGRAMDSTAMTALGPGRVDAEFQFTAVDLGGAEKTRFRYRLDGYDRANHWTDSGARRAAYYTNIPPGQYRFEVIATTRDGEWTTAPARMALAVAPFAWQRRPVQAAALFVLLLMTGWTVRRISLRRARARVAELEREQAVERERSRIARDLHDDLGSRLSYIAMMAEANAGDGIVAAASRDAARTMDELVWAVNARNDTVSSFALYLSQFAEEHIAASGKRCRLIIPSDLPARPLNATVRRHLYLACKEAVTNAIKHSAAAEIRLSLDLLADELVISIADDGRGLPPEIDPTGNGLRNYQERMSQVGGFLDVHSVPGRGTAITFRTPL